MTRGGAEGEATPSVLRTYDDVHPAKWTKRQRIQFLLDRWGDIFEPDIASSLSASGGGSGLDAALPKMAHHWSVVELLRCMRLLAQTDLSAHNHLKAFRCSAEWRQVRAMIRVRLQSGRWDEIPGWRRERIVPHWIDPRLVLRAEKALEESFRGDVFIPKDLWDGLTKV